MLQSHVMSPLLSGESEIICETPLQRLPNFNSSELNADCPCFTQLSSLAILPILVMLTSDVQLTVRLMTSLFFTHSYHQHLFGFTT